LFSMLKIWNGAFWKVADSVPVRLGDRRWVRMSAVAAGLTLISIGIGLGAEPVMQVAMKAAERALDQDAYAGIVLSQAGKDMIR